MGSEGGVTHELAERVMAGQYLLLPHGKSRVHIIVRPKALFMDRFDSQANFSAYQVLKFRGCAKVERNF